MERLSNLSKPKWLAVYTRSRCEKQVLQILQQRGITAYCPLVKTIRQWSDRKKTVQQPLIPSYVFVKVTEGQRNDVLQIPSVLNFLYWLGKPAVVRDEEIVALENFLNDYSEVSAESLVLNKGDRVRIASGALKNQQGVVLERNRGRVILQLEQIGYQIKAVISTNKLLC